MKDTQFAFADAKVRALENNLLTASELEQMTEAAGIREILEILKVKGWQTEGAGNDFYGMLSKESERVFEEVADLAGDTALLTPLVLPNDFHNIKTALKALVSGTNPDDYYIRPTTVDIEKLYDRMAEKQYDNLPVLLQQPARQCYSLLIRTGDGQAVDIYLDTCMLKSLLEAGRNSESELMREYCELFVALCDIKTAYRAAKAGKNAEFLEQAICGSNYLDGRLLAEAAVKGADQVISLTAQSPLSGAAEQLKISMSAFEKWCDDEIIRLIGKAKLKSFGPDPLIAYYLARQAEIKAVRIVLVCRAGGADTDVIRERMRELYV